MIKDDRCKAVLFLNPLVVPSMPAVANGSFSLLVARFVVFPTNHRCLLVTLVVVILVGPVLVSFLPMIQLSIFDDMNLRDILL